MLTLVHHTKTEAEALGCKVIAEVELPCVPMITDRINVTTLQAVVRYKYGLEVGPRGRSHSLEFTFSKDGRDMTVSIDDRRVLTAQLAPAYTSPAQRALSHVEELWHIDGVSIPVTHQSHTLAKLYEHPLIATKR